MRSPHCRTRWHDRCEVTECECDCHDFADVAQGLSADVSPMEANEDAGSSPAVSFTMTAPPSHPLPFDHGKYRVAEEQIGTDLTKAWVLDYCIECKEPTWTHNAVIAGKRESLCETCAYLLVSDYAEQRVKAENRRAPYVNIFGR